VREKLGIRREVPSRPAPSASIHNMQRRAAQSSAATEYTYRQADGTPYLRVKRTAAKQFFQAHWNGSAWVNGAPKGPKIPYRLPELLAAVHDTVFVVEGEKDADALTARGFVATTSSGGAGKWTADLNQHFAGKTIFVLADNDEKGAEHAQQVAENLHGIAASVRIIDLPGLPPKGDVSDWIEAGNDTAGLVDLCRAAPSWTPDGAGEQASPLAWLDMSRWDGEAVPERQWAIRDRVPARQAGLFSGEGGTGKSILELAKNVAHVTGKDWLFTMPEKGPAIYLGAEDDKDEIHIRLAAIAARYGVTFKELVAGGLHILPLLGQDATLCAATGKSGKVETTALYRQVYEAAGDIKPKNISIDTLSRAFAGNEIDRVQVYGFVMHMQALAMVAGSSVTVLSHPSLAGIASGTGLSGSTAWHGAFRFRQYLTSVKPESGEQPDNDLRQLEFKKNQYGPLGENIVLRYDGGLFLPVPGVSNLAAAARDAKAEEVFIALLARFEREGRNVTDKPGPTYAPTAFAGEDEAKKAGIRKDDFKGAQRRLFAAGKIRIETLNRPGLIGGYFV